MSYEKYLAGRWYVPSTLEHRTPPPDQACPTGCGPGCGYHRRRDHDHYDALHTISAPADNRGAEGQPGVSTSSLYPPACLLSPHHGAASAALGKAKDGGIGMRTFVCVHYESEGYEREMWVNVNRILFFIRRGDRTQLKLDADVDLRVKETPDEIREQLQED